METASFVETNTQRVYFDLLRLLAAKEEYTADKLARYSPETLVEELEKFLKAEKQDESSALTLEMKLTCSDLAAHLIVALQYYAKEQQKRYTSIKCEYNKLVDSYNETIKKTEQNFYDTAVSIAVRNGYTGSTVNTFVQTLLNSTEAKATKDGAIADLRKTYDKGFKMFENYGFAGVDYDGNGHAKYWDDKNYKYWKDTGHESKTNDILAVAPILNSFDRITQEIEMTVCYAEAVLRRLGIEEDKILREVHRKVEAPEVTEETLDPRVLQAKFEQAQAAAKYLSLYGNVVVLADGTLRLANEEKKEYRYFLQERNVKKVCSPATADECVLILLRNGRVKLVANPAHSDYEWEKTTYEEVNRKLETVTGIVDIVCVHDMCYLLTYEGRVQCVTLYGDMESFSDVLNWTDIRQVAASSGHVVGLRRDGTVVACGFNIGGSCNVGGWKDIIAVAAEEIDCDAYEELAYTLGLTKDGRVLFAGGVIPGREREHRQIATWRNVVQISTCASGICALTAYGTVKLSGYCGFPSGYYTWWIDENSQSDASEKVFMDQETDMERWTGVAAVCGDRGIGIDGSISGTSLKLFDDVDDLMILDAQAAKENERLLEEEQRREEERLEAERTKATYRRMKLCQHCGGSFKGLFKKVCTACGKQKDY